MKTSASIFGFIICISLIAAQPGPRADAGDPPGLNTPATGKQKLLSLFDPGRLNMNHSYSFMVASDGNRTVSSGLYLNTIRYQLSRPLLLTLKWGVWQPSFGSSGQPGPAGLSADNLVIPGFELQYRPLDNLVFRIEYSNMYLPAQFPGSPLAD